MDRCGISASWTQMIHIVKPSTNLFADASGYQLAAPGGYIQLRNSSISQYVLSQGRKFSMQDSTIYNSSTAESFSGPDNGQYPDVSLVLDSCPTHKLDPSYLPDGTVMYGETQSKSGKAGEFYPFIFL